MKKIFFFYLLFLGTTQIFSQHKKSIKNNSHKKIIAHNEIRDVSIATVNVDSLQQLLSNSKQPVLVKIHADWCGPCQRMMPVFEQIALTCSNKVKVVKLMMKSFVDSDPVINFLKKEHNVTIHCVPTFLLILNNKIVDVFEGSMNFDEFNKKLIKSLQKINIA